MRPSLWVMAALLPLGAQPKLLVNAKLDTRSAAAGLEQTFRPLVKRRAVGTLGSMRDGEGRPTTRYESRP